MNSNGTATGYHFDNLNRLVNVTNWGAGNNMISSYAYALNNAGIRTAVTEADGSYVAYGYDAVYKLTSEVRTGGSIGSPTGYSTTYTYDNVGNRLTQMKDGVLTNYAYNNRDQLTTESSPLNAISYIYDHAGRMTDKTDNAGAMGISAAIRLT
jgi:YD repeat-containing protein